MQKIFLYFHYDNNQDTKIRADEAEEEEENKTKKLKNKKPKLC